MPFSNQTQRMICDGSRSFANAFWIVTLIIKISFISREVLASTFTHSTVPSKLPWNNISYIDNFH